MSVAFLTIQDGDEFEFLSPEEEPVIPKAVRKRATKALKAVALDLLDPDEVEEEEEGEKEPWYARNCICYKKKSVDKEVERPATELSPLLKRAKTQGLKMMKKVFFPSIPALFQDLWVYAELGITLFAFIFGLFDLFPIEENVAFQIAYLTLTIIGIILALIDANIYFFELGSCARGIKVCRKYVKKRRQGKQSAEAFDEVINEDSDSESESEDEETQQKTPWYRLSPKWKERFSTWFELIRTILSELLLYPLLIFDLFGFVTESAYLPESSGDRVNFSLFLVGGFYLILAVYIMRVFMVAGAMSSLLKIPLTKKQSSDDGGKHIDVIIKFCIHLIGQIVVHLMILVVVGAKIADENINPEMNASNASDISGSGMNSSSQSNTIRASAFLGVAIVLGGVIPLIGIIMFFVANYYWMQEFSIGFWVNMVALLQGQGFAETVFGGEGTAPSKELAQSFAEKVKYKDVNKQLRKFHSPPFHTKFLYPIRIPLAGASCFAYGASLVIFIVCIALTSDENGTISIAIFKSDNNILTVFFVLSTTCIVIANIHVLLLFVVGLVGLMLLVVMAFPAVVLLVLLLLFIYVPYGFLFAVKKVQLSSRKGKTTRRVTANDTVITNNIELWSISNDSGHDSS